MTLGLLLAAAMLIACLLCQKLTDRIGVPTLVAFIGIGMVFGSDGILRIPFDNYEFAQDASTIALIFIMFYGGFGTNWKQARPVAGKAALLSSAGVVATAFLTGLFCHFALRLPLWEGMLVGAVLGSTDAASVFSILRSKRLNLRYNTASLLEVESGSNDPFAYMMTVVVIAVLGSGTQTGVWTVLSLLARQLVFGAAAGAAISLAAVWILARVRLAQGMAAIFVVAVALFSYALPAVAGGNGFLSAYLVGMVLGNRPIGDKRALVHFFDGVTGLMQMALFFLLGLLSFPSRLPAVFLPSLAVALFLTFVARPAAVFALLTPLRCKAEQMALISWAGLRGAASIVFAVLAVMNVPALQGDLFHMVFLVVLFSILLQGTLLPAVAKRLRMIGRHDVLRTFNDYSEAAPVQFFQFTVPPRHPWANRRVSEITLPPDTICVLVQRKKELAETDGSAVENIAPKGDTMLLPGDVVTLGARSPENVDGVALREVTIGRRDTRAGQTVAQLSAASPSTLIVMIERGKRVIIPRGTTRVMTGDILVLR